MIRAWLQFKAIAILGVALAASVAFGGVQTLRVKSAQTANDKLRLEVAGMKLAVDLSEQLRGQEQDQARASFSAQADRCEARVDQARKAASLIEEITNGTITHPSSAVASQPAGGHRAIVPAGQLRGIIGQAAAGQAAGVPSGSKPGAAR